MQGYSKGTVGPYISVHFNVYVVYIMQGYGKGIVGPSKQSIIIDN
jgi:hypothetical protein